MLAEAARPSLVEQLCGAARLATAGGGSRAAVRRFLAVHAMFDITPEAAGQVHLHFYEVCLLCEHFFCSRWLGGFGCSLQSEIASSLRTLEFDPMGDDWELVVNLSRKPDSHHLKRDRVCLSRRLCVGDIHLSYLDSTLRIRE